MQFPEYNIPYENWGETVERRKDKRGHDYLFISNRSHAENYNSDYDGWWTSATILPNPTEGITIFVWYRKGDSRWVNRFVVVNFGQGWHIGPRIGTKLLDEWCRLAHDELDFTWRGRNFTAEEEEAMDEMANEFRGYDENDEF